MVSYLLIGFWFHKKSTAEGSLKAFLVNRIGDFGLISGIALVASFSGELSFAAMQSSLSVMSNTYWTIFNSQIATTEIAAFLLFMGAMAKSAQIPLHVWLPESMEGPTPISALIHAATMVTAGIYMVSRLCPLYELAPQVQNIILLLGAGGGLGLGSSGLSKKISNELSRTNISQLGYMAAATPYHL